MRLYLVLVTAFFISNFSVTVEENGKDITLIDISDGWYSVRCVIDENLVKQVLLGRIYIGQKLRIYGAVFLLPDGVSPLEVTDNKPLLSLGFNGVQIAPWYTKLGFQKQRPFLKALKFLSPAGGAIPAVFEIFYSNFVGGYCRNKKVSNDVLRKN